jgi:predicted dehydrogenase
MINAGIIGLGKMGISHYSILNTHPEVRVSAVCDSSGFLTGSLSKFSDVAVFNDYRDMLNSCELDCAIVATPTSSHKPIVNDCLNRNLHVFVEKPFCLNFEEGREVSQNAVARRVVNQVGYHHRFIGTFHRVKEFIDAGTIGEIYHICGEAYGPVVVKPKGTTWRTLKSQGGGCLHDYASHVIDLMNYFVGPPTSVSGTVLQRVFSREVEDAVFSTLHYSKDLSGRLSVNWSDETYRKMSTIITLYGRRGKIIVDRQECKVYLSAARPEFNLAEGWNVLYTTDLTAPVWFYLRGEEYSAQIDYFVRRISEKQGADNLNSFRNALQTHGVIAMLTQDSGKRG